MPLIFEDDYNSSDDPDYECDSTATCSESESDSSDGEEGKQVSSSATPAAAAARSASTRPTRQAAVNATINIRTEIERLRAAKAKKLAGNAAPPKLEVKATKTVKEPAKKKAKSE